ncbi:1-propanol dehydrogenase PduQ [uncultured Enterococcus sp.]|uniref:1-propanol dehydrogenase PduQ n=1 Tax=uncultured Enterococcus sp. TaxID=167972 RepID=UPI002AA7BF26|nr:1-propanol dehydrogenase PduQ [uncultured Enterococcus sp.]
MRTINNQFTLKTKIIANQGSLKELEKLKGEKAFIVSDKIMAELGYLSQVIDCLRKAQIGTESFTGIRPDPDTKVIAEGLKAFQKADPDVLIAIGGGSAIDAAKGILYAASQFLDSKKKRPYFVAIPSTSGTGSEVTDFSVITAGGDKICLVDEYIAPDLAILDATCIKNVPDRVVIDTGIDVLVHATEAYVSSKATDFTDAMAEKTIQLVFEHLPLLHKDIQNSYSRDRLHNASCMAGIAFTNAGLGITHSLSHAVGGKFHLAHGRCNAMLLEAVIDYNAGLQEAADTEAAKKYAKLARILQLPARTTREGVVSYIDAIKKLKREVGIEAGFKELSIDQKEYEESLEYMTQAAINDRCTPSNPREPSLEELQEIYKKVY